MVGNHLSGKQITVYPLILKYKEKIPSHTCHASREIETLEYT